MNLLIESLRIAIEKATNATAQNNQGVLSICTAYTSSDEILNAVQDPAMSKALWLTGQRRSKKIMVSVWMTLN